jgi:hypothetical protein
VPGKPASIPVFDDYVIFHKEDTLGPEELAGPVGQTRAEADVTETVICLPQVEHEGESGRRAIVVAIVFVVLLVSGSFDPADPDRVGELVKLGGKAALIVFINGAP